jgi:hypothetical protein
MFEGVEGKVEVKGSEIIGRRLREGVGGEKTNVAWCKYLTNNRTILSCT